MGFKGINIITKRGSANKPVIGFRGIIIGLQVNLPVKVVDGRGRGLSNVQVTIENPDTLSPVTAFTDGLGNCLLNEDGSNPNPVTVIKDKVTKEVDYTGGDSFTVVVDNRYFME